MKKTYLTVLVAGVLSANSYTALAGDAAEAYYSFCGEDEEIFACPFDDNNTGSTSYYLCANEQGAYYIQHDPDVTEPGEFEEFNFRYPEVGQTGQFFVSEYEDEDYNTEYRVRFKHQDREFVIYNQYSPPLPDENTMFPYGGFTHSIMRIKDGKLLSLAYCGRPSLIDKGDMNSLAEQEPFNHQLWSYGWFR